MWGCFANIRDESCRATQPHDRCCTMLGNQITRACILPLKSLCGGDKIIIVHLSLQPTPKDKKASLVIHGLVDKQVITGDIHDLNLWIPPYVQVDPVQISLTQFSRLSRSENKYVKWWIVFSDIKLLCHSSHQLRGFLRLARSQISCFTKQPFVLKSLQVAYYLVDLLGFTFCFLSCINNQALKEQGDSISHDKDVMVEMLRNSAIQNQCLGQVSLVKREILLSPKMEIAVCTVATNIFRMMC
ncbi:NAD-dependent protein deacetylase SRT1-like isoform X3 [Mangifera indica]|uniref:NAD-dependent protein deacetylase SRT1-like isoform X3 n=1 Tax=Mangifera indica TaxID=29780 RepID=UPI001CF99693|nr:NAD-dependent protein deacetylase SRT1-like isoform X3 [Mangifera indica]